MSVRRAAGRLLRRGAVTLAALAVLALAQLAPASADTAASALPQLRILEFGGGRGIFDALSAGLLANAGPAVQGTVDHGSFAAFRAFCDGPDGTGPDILLTTWRVSGHDQSSCSSHDSQPMAELELGRGALVLVVRRGSDLTALTSQQVYLALARDIPYRGEFRRNTAIRWSDIDRSLPAEDIRFQLPPREAGGRSLFDALVLEAGCRQEPLVMQIFLAQPRTARCVTTRVDRVREVPHDQAVRELLEAPEGTVGVLAYADLAKTGGALVPLALDGVMPTDQTILDDAYGVAGSYWMYVRRGQPGSSPVVNNALTNLIALADSEEMIGPNGVLSSIGMLPLPSDQREAQVDAMSGRDTSYYGFGTVAGWVATIAERALTLAGLSYGEIETPTNAQSIDLTKLMGIAGFKIKDFETSIGIIPSAGMTFGIVRQMSAGDQVLPGPDPVPGFAAASRPAVGDPAPDHLYNRRCELHQGLPGQQGGYQPVPLACGRPGGDPLGGPPAEPGDDARAAGHRAGSGAPDRERTLAVRCRPTRLPGGGWAPPGRAIPSWPGRLSSTAQTPQLCAALLRGRGGMRRRCRMASRSWART